MGQKEESMFKEKNIINDNKGGIGAIIIVPDPIKAFDFILVLCFLSPSKLQVTVPAPIFTNCPITLSPI